jgi:hypothetical protein
MVDALCLSLSGWGLVMFLMTGDPHFLVAFGLPDCYLSIKYFRHYRSKVTNSYAKNNS